MSTRDEDIANRRESRYSLIESTSRKEVAQEKRCTVPGCTEPLAKCFGCRKRLKAYCHDHAFENDVEVDCEAPCSATTCVMCGKERENSKVWCFWKKSDDKERIDICSKCIARSPSANIVKKYDVRTIRELGKKRKTV